MNLWKAMQKASRLPFANLQPANWTLLRSYLREAEIFLKFYTVAVTHGQLVACAFNKTTFYSDKNVTGQQEHIDTHIVCKINQSAVFCWINTYSAKFKKKKQCTTRIPESYLYHRITRARQELHFCLLQIFFWLNVLAAKIIIVQYSTWFSYSTGRSEVLLLCFSLLWQFLKYQASQLTTDLFLFWTVFSSNKTNTNI